MPIAAFILATLLLICPAFARAESCDLFVPDSTSSGDIFLLKQKGFAAIKVPDPAHQKLTPGQFSLGVVAREGLELYKSVGSEDLMVVGRVGRAAPSIQKLPRCRDLQGPNTERAVLRSVVASRGEWALAVEQKLKTFKWGEFLLLWEAAEMQMPIAGKDFRARLRIYRSLVEKAGAVNSFSHLQKLEGFRQLVVQNQLGVYCRKRESVMDVLDPADPCGQCVARAWLITAVAKDANLDWGAENTLSLQLFSDHVQAVLFNKASGILMDVQSGRPVSTTDQDKGFILLPEFIIWSTLRKHGESSSHYTSVNYRGTKMTIRLPSLIYLPLFVLHEIQDPISDLYSNKYYNLGPGAGFHGGEAPERSVEAFRATSYERPAVSVGKLASLKGWFSRAIDFGFLENKYLVVSPSDFSEVKDIMNQFIASLIPEERAIVDAAWADHNYLKAMAAIDQLGGRIDQLIGFRNGHVAQFPKKMTIIPPRATDRYVHRKMDGMILLGDQTEVDRYNALSIRDRWAFAGRHLEETFIELASGPEYRLFKNVVADYRLFFSLSDNETESLLAWRVKLDANLKLGEYAMAATTTSFVDRRREWLTPNIYFANEMVIPVAMVSDLIEPWLKFEDRIAAAHREFAQDFKAHPDSIVNFFTIFGNIGTVLVPVELKNAFTDLSPEALYFGHTNDLQRLKDYNRANWGNPGQYDALRLSRARNPYRRLAIHLVTDLEFEFRHTKAPPRPLRQRTDKLIPRAKDQTDRAGVAEMRPDETVPTDRDSFAGQNGPQNNPQMIQAELVSGEEYRRLRSRKERQQELEDLLESRREVLLPTELWLGLLKDFEHETNPAIELLFYPILDAELIAAAEGKNLLNLISAIRTPRGITIGVGYDVVFPELAPRICKHNGLRGERCGAALAERFRQLPPPVDLVAENPYLNYGYKRWREDENLPVHPFRRGVTRGRNFSVRAVKPDHYTLFKDLASILEIPGTDGIELWRYANLSVGGGQRSNFYKLYVPGRGFALLIFSDHMMDDERWVGYPKD